MIHVGVTSQLGRLVDWMTALMIMRVLVAFVVLVVLPCVSAVDRELADGEAAVGTDPQAVEPATAPWIWGDMQQLNEYLAWALASRVGQTHPQRALGGFGCPAIHRRGANKQLNTTPRAWLASWGAGLGACWPPRS